MDPTWDVLVAGAGPAGSAAAALLAEAGHRVLVLEKETFPRFRIGESLLPACLPVLDRLGVEPDPSTFVFKRGAEFVCEQTGRTHVFAFDEALPGVPNHAWHVERPLFDTLLRDRAAALGAEVRHGETVVDVELGTEHVRVRTTTGTEDCRFFVDATGQTRLLARRLGSVRHLDLFGTSAAFTHYEGLGPAYAEVFGERFDIRIMIRPEGWGWIIPLPARRLSVGLVSRGKVSAEDLERGLLSGPLVTRLTAGARRLETRIVGNFSYENTAPHGARYATVGDAASFLDPVFSTGVTLALRGAQGLAQVLGPALEAGAEDRADLLDEHGRSMNRAYRTFAALIERFYHSNFVDSFFLRGMPDYDMRRGVMSVLAGDVWRTGNPFQEMLLSGRRQYGVSHFPPAAAAGGK